MRLKYFLSAAMLSALFAACSDDIGNGNNEQPEGEGKSYVNIAINLPTVNGAGTRADESQKNDQFYDGEVSEYAVKCAHLVIFRGTTEEDAIAEQVYKLNGLKPWEDNEDENITVTARTVQAINQAPTNNSELWALIVLNDENAESHFPANTKFSDLTTNVAKFDITSTTNGFYMANAPLYNEGTPSTLVKLEKAKIYNSEAAAQADKEGINIFVERGLAKVTVTEETEGSKEVTVNGEEYAATITAWALDITNKTTYPIRNVSEFTTKWKDLQSTVDGAANAKRFYSKSSNRIYWAIDPNYSTTSANAFNELASNAVITTKPEILYCLENTFNVRNQRQDRTTRVVFKAQFASKGSTTYSDFYTLGTNAQIYDKAGMQTAIKAQAIKLFTNKSKADLYSFAENTSVSLSAGPHTIGVGDISYDGTALTESEIAQLNDAIGTINTYKNGTCYYVARIQHFGQFYTPWVNGTPAYGETNGESGLSEAENNYLGRYGVVRNNWYELKVTGVRGLGSPVIPDPEDKPDDENEYYLNFKVNIHAWAKRVQNVVL